jgi:RHS repeat-associated protein
MPIALEFDYSNRLSGWTKPDGQRIGYSYDGNGNRISSGSATATYDERNRQLTDGSASNTWTSRGTLDSTTVNGVTTQIGFDGLDRLIQHGNTTYQYDALDRIEQRDGSAMTYSGLLQEPTSIGGTVVARGPTGAPIAAATNGAAANLMADRHGDVTLSLTTAGGIESSRAFDPWGSMTATIGSPPPVGFQGQYTDSATSSTKMGARWYSSGLAGFLSRDEDHSSLADPVTRNRFLYANANPIEFSDPDGRSAVASSKICMDPRACGQFFSFKVPKIAGEGTIIVNYFIEAKELGGWLRYRGDGRKFKARASCGESRVCIRMDLETGNAWGIVNFSCRVSGSCFDAYAINGQVNRITNTVAGGLSMTLKYSDPSYAETLNFAFQIDSRVTFTHDRTPLLNRRGVEYGYRESRRLVIQHEKFPSVEVYRLRNGAYSTLYQYREKAPRLGIPLGLAPIFSRSASIELIRPVTRIYGQPPAS